MKKFSILFIAAVFVFNISGCSDDDVITSVIPVNSSEGVYILSEGGFNAGTSKLSFYNTTRDSFYADIFNPGNLGITPDGMIWDNDNLYITEQGNFGSMGKIYRTDTNGTVISSNDVGTSPYSLAIANDKIYITNGPANNVSVVDKNSFALITTINVGLYPQEILAVGNKVFVCNTSLFTGETDSTVSVIDAGTDMVVATIEVRYAPSSIALSTDGMILVGCPGDSTKSGIFKIDPVTNNKLDSFTNLTHGFSRDLSVMNSDQVCFIAGDVYAESDIVIYTFSSRTPSVLIPKPASPALFYSLTYDRDANLYYAGYVPSFSTSGQFRIYNTGGALQKEFTVTGGYAPRRLVIKR